MPGFTWCTVSARQVVGVDGLFEVDGGNLFYEIVEKKFCKNPTFKHWTRYETFSGDRRLRLEWRTARFHKISSFDELYKWIQANI